LSRKFRILTTAAAAASTLVAALLVHQANAAAQSPTLRNGELVADGAWCWFQDPRAVHYVGAHDRTYIGYVTSRGDIDIAAQDAGTALITRTTLHPLLQADDHAAPGLSVLPDGRIAAFYSKHGGTQMLYRISVRAEDITAFGPELTVPTNTTKGGVYTYGNPVYLSAEHRLYLFFRSGDNRPAMTWTSAASGFKSWAIAKDLVVPDGVAGAPRPYIKYATNGVDTISFAFTDGHPREVANNSVYAAVYRKGVLRAPDGTRLSVIDATAEGDETTADAGLPLGPAHTNWLRPSTAHPQGNGGLVYDGSGPGGVGWVEAMALSPQNVPVIVYSTYADPTDAIYRYARWNGSGWTDSAITDAGGKITTGEAEPQYSGGADLDHNDPSTVYLSRETYPGSEQWELEVWTTGDGGATFASHHEITSDSVLKNVRPVVPWGSPGEIKLLWMVGSYDIWNGGYRTQLRELTVGRAPTSARISTSTLSSNAGAAVHIAGRIVQGADGSDVAGAMVQLLGHTAGKPDTVLRTDRADIAGLAQFTVYPTATMRFSVRVLATGTWGGATSAAPVVTVRQPSAVRISVSPTSIKHGKSVIVGARAVDANTGVARARSIIELWQSAAGAAWQRVGAYRADTAGLIRVTRTPGVSVAYQGRLLAGPEYQAASSPPAAVRVR
jgi:putative BNR repeat neuraminidase